MKYRLSFLIFFLGCIFITLFPPCTYELPANRFTGELKDNNFTETTEKSYEFLFGQNQMELHPESSAHKYFYNRKIIYDELALEYFLFFFIVASIRFTFDFIKRK